MGGEQPLSEATLSNCSAFTQGVNLIDLERWTKDNITDRWLGWMRESLTNRLWPRTTVAGTIGLAQIAQRGGVQCIDGPSLKVLPGLGRVSHTDLHSAGITQKSLEHAYALHYDGDAKPWD